MNAVERYRRMNLGSSLYDAAQAGDGQRSAFWLAFPLTGEKEFTQYTRKNILKKKRALEANLPIVGAIIEKVGRYSVGRGLFPIPQTKDMEWNEKTMFKFDEWASNPVVCDSAGLMNFWEMQNWVAKTYFGEAEAFCAFVNSAKAGSPQLQTFDNGEVEYLPGTGAAEIPPGTFTYWDGVKLNSRGRVVGYSIRTMDGGGYVDVSTYDMMHICHRKRPNQYRGLSPFHAGANSAVDVMDIKGLEIASAKLHSALGVTISKKSGPGVGPQGLTGNLQALLTGENGGTKDVGENFMAGAMIAHLGENEEMKLLSSDRPSMNMLDFLAWLYRDLSVGCGLPVELIWNMSELGGANSRIVLADGQWFFDSIQDKVNDAFNYRVWVWWLSSLFASGDLEMPKDPEWWKVEWQGPPKITADAGNTAQSEIDQLNSGLGTWSKYWGRHGGNWKPQITQRISEVKYAQDECTRLGVDYEKVFPQKAGAPAAQTSEDANQQDTKTKTKDESK